MTIRQDTDTVPLRQAVAELLDRWDEHGKWMRRLDATYREGFHVGRQVGYEAGYAQAVLDWKITAGLVDGGPEFAELDRLRYPPGGRLSWIIPRTAGDDAV